MYYRYFIFYGWSYSHQTILEVWPDCGGCVLLLHYYHLGVVIIVAQYKPAFFLAVKLAKHEDSKRSKGYAFIQYASQDDAISAMEQMDQKVHFPELSIFFLIIPSDQIIFTPKLHPYLKSASEKCIVNQRMVLVRKFTWLGFTILWFQGSLVNSLNFLGTECRRPPWTLVLFFHDTALKITGANWFRSTT